MSDEKEWARLLRALGPLETRLSGLVLDAIQEHRDRLSFTKINQFVTEQRWEELLHYVSFSGPGGLPPSWALMLDTLVDRTIALGRDLSVLSVRFDGYNPRVVEHFSKAKLEIGKSFTDLMREGIRQVMENGFLHNEDPKTMARRIRRIVGLTPQQAQAVENYRRALEEKLPNALQRKLRDHRYDKTVARALAGETTLTATQIDTMVRRYEERYLKFHAEEIARTQALEALAFVQQETWAQAVEAGQFSVTSLVRRWYVAHDERVCPVCAPIPEMNPDGVGLNEPFQTPKGPLMRPLAHPQCRCIVFTRPRLRT